MTNSTGESYLLQLKSLPVNDLQSLLTFAGQSRTGKRHELLDRCHSLVQSSKMTRDKFEELYNKRFGQGDLPTIPYPKDLKNTFKTAHHHLQTHHQQQLNIELHFSSLTFNEELFMISPPCPIPPVKQLNNDSQSLANFYFLLSAQLASGLTTKI